MIKIKSTLLLFFTTLRLTSAYAQGCSDAGICTAPTIRLTDTSVLSGDKANTLSAGAVFGTAQYNVKLINMNAEYTRRIGKQFIISGKASYSVVFGPQAINTGLADAVLTCAYSFNDRFTPMIGVKIPLSNANEHQNGLPLPMAYQTSLGTTDLLAGLTYTRNKWGIALAWQQPLVQNQSSFFVSDYPTGSIDDRYVSTNGFKRKADLLVRAYYNVRLNNKLLFTPGILPIYHIANDEWTDKTGKEHTIPGSRGLTLNTNVALRYTVQKNVYLRFTAGAPVLARKVRPEGLTKFGILAEYIRQF